MPYTLEFQEGYGFRSDPDPVQFEALNKRDAIRYAGDLLGIERRVTEKMFHEHGGKRILYGDQKIFPG